MPFRVRPRLPSPRVASHQLRAPFVVRVAGSRPPCGRWAGRHEVGSEEGARESGPAAPIIVVENEQQAIIEANNSEFGLGASIWTNDIERGIRLARQVESGIVSVNEMVKSDPRLPFGGIKKSGIGRELSEFGIKEFVNIKSIVVKDITSKLLVE